jgi:ABC-type amino acid transport substrate-binding protein
MIMKQRRLFAALMLAAILALAIAGPASAAKLGGADQGGRLLTTTLTGAEEVPVPGDPDGTGFAAVTVNPGQGVLCYELSVSGIAPAMAAHIHEAPFGEAGDVVVGLEAPTDGSSGGCIDVGRALAKDILKNPADYYVNVHNAEFPGGALRGQLSK